MPTPYQGGQALGDMLFGGRQQGNSDVFLKRLRENYDAKRAGYDSQKALDQAAEAQVQRLARERITADIIAKANAGDPQALAELGAATLQTADTPNLKNYTGGLRDYQDMGYQRQAAERATLGDMAGANAALVGTADGPLKMNDIDSGYQLNPYEAGGAAKVTPGEQADIGTAQARQSELGARENLSNVRAAGGGWAPRSSGKRSASAAKAIVATLEKEMGRKLTAQEVDTIYAGGDFNFRDELPQVALGESPKKARNPRVTQVGGKPVVRVNSPEEAKAAWEKLAPGSGLMFPNGTIRYKD